MNPAVAAIKTEGGTVQFVHQLAWFPVGFERGIN